MALVIVLGMMIAWPDIAAAKPSNEAKLAAQIQTLKKKARESASAIRFWKDGERGKWRLHLRHVKCWNIHGKQRRQVCKHARSMLKLQEWRRERLEAKIEKLSPLLLDVGIVAHWLCIHSHERGADGWKTNTGNDYYGGLQMDMDFQRAHGLDFLLKKGTADKWTPREQMAVAERAKRGIRTSQDEYGRVFLWQDEPRWYNPWPKTGRMCGLVD